ncbi:kinesin-like protein KIF18A [Planococcus citri]|uniref:kinesin-like protein KIF18A n=1 Tax=Planococcus citri TaxID=170843 RepID=UPI0031F73191
MRVSLGRKSPGPKPRLGRSTEMKVYIRVRPFNEREKDHECRSIVKQLDDKVLVFDPKENDQPFFFHGVKQRMRDITKKQNKEIQFIFDQIYGASSTNEDVYTGSISNILPSLLEGYNCSVFVYGATGAGKTFTMLGNDQTPGIIYLTMQSLYEKINELQDEKHFDIGISYLEVYNEKVFDLLNPSKEPLRLIEDSVNGVIVAGIKLIQISEVEHLFDLLRQGNANRTQHPTDANAESSRSHAVFQVFIKIQQKSSERVQIVKLSMIDLAGSERGAATNFKGSRFKEGAHINKSLLALGNCINNLADNVKHIPYRNSQLTRLLKDSLGGNCQTVMIACVGPTPSSYEDTYNTLKYAARAKTIKTTIAKTVMSIDGHINNYKQLIQELQNKNAALENELRTLSSQPKVGDLTSWREKIRNLFTQKKSYHQEILNIESKEKLLLWKIKYKSTNAEIINSFHDCNNDADSLRLGVSVNRMEGTVNGLHSRMAELWDAKFENDELINNLKNEIEKNNLIEALEKDFIINELQISEMEKDIHLTHRHKFNNLMFITNETQKNIILRMAEQYNQHHNLLRGFNKVTGTMVEEKKDISNMLKGNYNITWDVSPHNENKRRTDMLNKYSTLSLDILHSHVKPCPLISLNDENEEDEEMKLAPQEEKIETDETNSTFVVPETVNNLNSTFTKNETFAKPLKSPRRIGHRYTPMKSKRIASKENMNTLIAISKRTPLIKPPNIRKTGTVSSFRTPKVPLGTCNK